jgi:hypothetical protein
MRKCINRAGKSLKDLEDGFIIQLYRQINIVKREAIKPIDIRLKDSLGRNLRTHIFNTNVIGSYDR